MNGWSRNIRSAVRKKKVTSTAARKAEKKARELKKARMDKLREMLTCCVWCGTPSESRVEAFYQFWFEMPPPKR